MELGWWLSGGVFPSSLKGWLDRDRSPSHKRGSAPIRWARIAPFYSSYALLDPDRNLESGTDQPAIPVARSEVWHWLTGIWLLATGILPAAVIYTALLVPGPAEYIVATLAGIPSVLILWVVLARVISQTEMRLDSNKFEVVRRVAFFRASRSTTSTAELQLIKLDVCVLNTQTLGRNVDLYTVVLAAPRHAYVVFVSRNHSDREAYCKRVSSQFGITVQEPVKKRSVSGASYLL